MMQPERDRGHHGIAAAGTVEGTADARRLGPLERLGVTPEAAALATPADQRRLRERAPVAAPDDPLAGGDIG